jgi:hypothetical protein
MKSDILRSNSFHLNLIQQSIGLQRNRNNFGLVTGLGVQLQYYRLDDNTTIEKTTDDVLFQKSLITVKIRNQNFFFIHLLFRYLLKFKSQLTITEIGCIFHREWFLATGLPAIQQLNIVPNKNKNLK